MTFGTKLSTLRKQNNYTQEQLASIMGVSRQAISKWESDTAYPETEKLIRMSELFGCSLHYLLKEEMESLDTTQENQNSSDDRMVSRRKKFFQFERKSDKMLWGMPLWHIGKNAKGILAVGLKARGVLAIGLQAKGVISLGLLPIGILSIGLFSLGLLSAGIFALGLLSAGCFCAGIIAAGAISIGVLSFGAIAIGDFSVGALSIGKYVAIGDNARAAIALGDSRAAGTIYEKTGSLSGQDIANIKQLIDTNVPSYLGWAKELIKEWLL